MYVLPTTLDDARKAVRAVMRSEHNLGRSGYGPPPTHGERREMLADPDWLDQFLRCCRWLAAAPRAHTTHQDIHSYRLKNIVERLDHRPVTNGAMIAAALHHGIQCERAGTTGYLGLSLLHVQEQDVASRGGPMERWMYRPLHERA